MQHEHQETGASPQMWVIWLHGLGASGHDFMDIVPWLQLPQDLSVRFLFPHAPEQAVTINGGMQMPSWYDIHQLGSKLTEDAAGMARMAQNLEGWLLQEMQASRRQVPVVLGGFSQGGAMAWYWAQRLQAATCLGCFALSSYRPCAQEPLSPVMEQMPAFVAHGGADPVVPWSWAQQTWAPVLQGAKSTLCVRPSMDHSVDAVEMEALGRFFQEVTL